MFDEAAMYVRTVARSWGAKNTGRLSIDGIRAEMNEYQKVDDETYWSFAARFMTNNEIQLVFNDAAEQVRKTLKLQRKRERR